MYKGEYRAMSQNDVLNPEQQEDFILQQDVSPTWVNDQEEIIPPDYQYVGDPSETYYYPSDIDGTRPIERYHPHTTNTTLQDGIELFNNIDIPPGEVILGFVVICVMIGILSVLMSLSAKYH